MNMDKIMPAKSKGELKLQAQEIIGEQAMDIRFNLCFDEKMSRQTN